jgi:hypothetical protein
MNIGPKINVPYEVYEDAQDRNFWTQGGMMLGAGAAGLAAGASLINPLNKLRFNRMQAAFVDNANTWKKLNAIHQGTLRFEDIPMASERELLAKRYEEVKHLFESKDLVNKVNADLDAGYANDSRFRSVDEQELMKKLLKDKVLKERYAKEYRDNAELDSVFSQIQQGEANPMVFQKIPAGQMMQSPLQLLRHPAALSGTMLGAGVGKVTSDELNKRRMRALVEQYNNAEGVEEPMGKESSEKRYDRFWKEEQHEVLNKQANAASAVAGAATKAAKKGGMLSNPLTLGMLGLSAIGTVKDTSKALNKEIIPAASSLKPSSAKETFNALQEQTAHYSSSKIEKTASSIYSKSMLQ